MATETARIVRLLEKTFEKHPWYGSSILEVLNLDPALASQRHGSGHSILELVRHMTSWRIFATRRLLGDNQFEITESLNFPEGGTWEEAIQQLKESQQLLVEAAKNFPDNRLGELMPGKTQKYTFYTLLHGILHHDIYHLGQIAMLKKG
jgi:uncharacterized damage-inducible protein DinB